MAVVELRRGMGKEKIDGADYMDAIVKDERESTM